MDIEKCKSTTDNVTDTVTETASRHTSIEKVTTDASATTENELTPIEAIKAYPAAIFWALMVSMCVVMVGYDTILIGNFFAYPTFQKKYGTYHPDIDKYQIPAAWQAGLTNASGLGSFFGALLNGYLVTKLGYKKVLIGSLIVLSGLLAVIFFSPNTTVLCIGIFVCGLPGGAFATIAPSYSSEVLPQALRAYLTSFTNMCFIIGQLIAAGVLSGLVNMTSEWGYKIPLLLQWMWPVILLPVLLFCPESPWHLVRCGRLEEAENSLRRLVRASSGIDAKTCLAQIVHTNNLEQEHMSTGTSYRDCFRGIELSRTEIACMAFAGQVLSGSVFAYNSTYFFEQVGLSTSVTYSLNLGGTGMALFGTLLSWFLLMPYFGQRTIYLWGMAGMSLILFLIGFLNIIPNAPPSIGMSQAVLTLVWTFLYQLSVGQLGWAVPAEVGSTRLRQKTICLARNAYYIVAVISNVIQPYLMSPKELNLRGYTGFVWGGAAFITFGWAFFRLPETKGRTFEELDILFSQKVGARKFSKAKIVGDVVEIA